MPKSWPRFLAQVDRDPSHDGCWMWLGNVRRGYGKFAGTVAHKYAYLHSVGPVPDGLELDHLCKKPLCVNPEHLEPVTRAENMRRRYADMTHCKRGHEFTPGNTYVWQGHRSCRACGRSRSAEYLLRKAAS